MEARSHPLGTHRGPAGHGLLQEIRDNPIGWLATQCRSHQSPGYSPCEQRTFQGNQEQYPRNGPACARSGKARQSGDRNQSGFSVGGAGYQRSGSGRRYPGYFGRFTISTTVFRGPSASTYMK